MGLQETVLIMENALCRVQKFKNGVARSVELPAQNRQHLEREGGYLGRAGICLSMKKKVNATNLRGTGLSLETRYGLMLVELSKHEALYSRRVTERYALVEGRRVNAGDSRMKFVELTFLNGEFFPSLSYYDRLQKTIKISETGAYLLHDQKVYTAHAFGAERKMIKSVVLVRGESDEKKKIRVGKSTVLLLFCRVVGRNKKRDKMAAVYFMECVDPGAVGDALGCICLQ